MRIMVMQGLNHEDVQCNFGSSHVRCYARGAMTLDGEWQTVTEENKVGFRFFKVVVVP